MPGPDLMVDQLEGHDSELVSRLNTAYRKVLVVGKDIFVPPIYSHRDRPYQFNIRQVRFMHYLSESNSVDKACELAEVSKSWALRFMKSTDYREFANDAVQDEAIQDGWTPRRIVLEIDSIYKGQRRVTEEQMDALKMMKDIVVPKQREIGTMGPGGVTVNLNFPALPPDVQSKLKEIADNAAIIDTHAA